MHLQNFVSFQASAVTLQLLPVCWRSIDGQSIASQHKGLNVKIWHHHQCLKTSLKYLVDCNGKLYHCNILYIISVHAYHFYQDNIRATNLRLCNLPHQDIEEAYSLSYLWDLTFHSVHKHTTHTYFNSLTHTSHPFTKSA